MANEISTYLYDGMQLPFEDWTNAAHSFSDLASVIQTTHDAAQGSAVKAINRMQTMRNWLMGYYIVEFEQHGKDRADYGACLLKRLEERVDRKGLNVTLFKWARKFYCLYPQMSENLPIALEAISNNDLAGQKGATVSHQFITAGQKLLSCLSFSHIREILTIDDPLARYFYEQECIKCTWSVRELRRQINTISVN